MHMRSDKKELTQRFLKTVKMQYGHDVARRVEDAKIELTGKENTDIKLDFLESGFKIPVSSAQLENSIDHELNKIVNTAIDTVTKLGGVTINQVDTIFMTRGSTALPSFEERVKKAFPSSKTARGDRFSSVVTGLGLTAIERYSASEQTHKSILKNTL